MTNLKNTYFRSFLIFEREDPGFGDGTEPSGYIKLEGRDGQGKLTASVQNLREDTGKLNYRLYIINFTQSHAHTVQVGLIPLQRGRGEVKWEYDIDDVAGTGASIHDFNVAVVIAEHSGRENKNIVCPMAAYRADKVAWREKVFGRQGDNTLINDLQNRKNVPVSVEPSPLKEPEFDEEVVEKQDVFSFKAKSFEEENIIPENTASENMNETGDIEQTETKDEVIPDILFQDNSVLKSFEENKGNQFPFSGQNINTFDPAKAFCPQASQVGGANPCMNCYAKNFHKPEEPRNEDVGKNFENMKKSFDKYFNVFDPFNSKRRDYKWWKVDSPVNLNNILYQSNIRTPLLFNPSVMMAHFKFRHLSVGIYTDRVKRREYLVCGIPGVFGIDTKPFGDMCKWVQLEGNSNRYGAFGYWIVYIDPKSGKFLSI